MICSTWLCSCLHGMHKYFDVVNILLLGTASFWVKYIFVSLDYINAIKVRTSQRKYLDSVVVWYAWGSAPKCKDYILPLNALL